MACEPGSSRFCAVCTSCGEHSQWTLCSLCLAQPMTVMLKCQAERAETTTEQHGDGISEAISQTSIARGITQQSSIAVSLSTLQTGTKDRKLGGTPDDDSRLWPAGRMRHIYLSLHPTPPPRLLRGWVQGFAQSVAGSRLSFSQFVGLVLVFTSHVFRSSHSSESRIIDLVTPGRRGQCWCPFLRADQRSLFSGGMN